jgi:hypothetical protein
MANEVDWAGRCKTIIAELIGIVLLVLVIDYSYSGELAISKQWCSTQGGQAEYRLSDGSRIDCLLEEYAVEVEWAHKWTEAVGQSLYYAAVTQKKPAILLLVRGKKDSRYVQRLGVIQEELGITVWYKHER